MEVSGIGVDVSPADTCSFLQTLMERWFGRVGNASWVCTVPLMNALFYRELFRHCALRRKNFFSWHRRICDPTLSAAHKDFHLGGHKNRETDLEEAHMDLSLKLNVLGAVVSFAFLTAIIVGML